MAQCLRDVLGGELVEAESDVFNTANSPCFHAVFPNDLRTEHTVKFKFKRTLNNAHMRDLSADMLWVWDGVKATHPFEKQA